MSMGYEVTTVLGQDGLLAVRQIEDFDFVLIGDEGTLHEREAAARWLKEELCPLPIIALCRGLESVRAADYQVSTAEPKNWFDAVADCIRRCRDLA